MFFNNFNQSFFAQIPILASNVGGNKEIVGKECVFELSNEKDFLEKIKNLRLPKASQGVFAIEKMIENYFSLFSSLNSLKSLSIEE